MLRKLGFVIAGTALTMFAMGRVESLASHRGFAGPAAWAQSWTDSDDDAADSQSDTVPDVGGNYTGTIEDHRFGMGDISADITQNGSALTGTWTASFGGPGTLKGAVKPNGKIHARLKITGGHGCGLNIQGTFKNGDEIAGKYQVTGCKKSDHGTFDVTD